VYEKGLVDVMHDHKDNPKFKGQNGWNRGRWNSITTKFNEKFPLAHFSKQQLQEKERELKGYYKAIMDSRKESGVGWNDTLCMVLAELEVWPRLILVSKLSLYNSVFVHSICSLFLLIIYFMLHLIGSPKGIKVSQQAIPSFFYSLEGLYEGACVYTSTFCLFLC
jgi:hypothetical protein